MNEQVSSLKISAKIGPERVNIALPSSKSIANRALIINALAGGDANLSRLSSARDTQTMIRLLGSDVPEWDVLDAGTTMRFLTAFGAVKGEKKILTGTARMKERPIGILVDALRTLGAKINYLEKDGYPPLSLEGFDKQLTDRLRVRGDVSSQYISALMMIAPSLPNGLILELTGKIGSRPYIDMTRAVMAKFGVTASWETPNTLYIASQEYNAVQYEIEPDWSAASYWYSIAAFSGKEVFLERVIDKSIQGDRKMADIMERLGVSTEFTAEGTLLKPTNRVESCSIDFSDCPDIAQTIAVIAAIQQVEVEMTGLESLRIKETDRIAALQNELGKIGSKLLEPETNERWVLEPGPIQAPKTAFETYHDHRMAMAFAPLAWKFDIEVIDPEVVNKSYPTYWDDLEKAGAVIEEL